jgi:Tol biopolymer transport system component
MVAALDGSRERTLAVWKHPEYIDAVAWSPDTATLAVSIFDERTGSTRLALVAVAGHRTTDLGATRWRGVDNLAWLERGAGLAVAGVAEGGDAVRQVWLVSYPDGRVRRITNDTNDYVGLSVSADGRMLATTQQRLASRLWMAPAANPGAGREVGGAATGDEWIFGLDASGTSVLFSSRRGSKASIWIMEADGTGRRPLTPDSLDACCPVVSQRARVVVFHVDQDNGLPHVWRMDLDGGGLRQVTNGAGETVAALSPDGETLLLWRLERSVPGTTVWKMPLSGGTPVKFLEQIDDVFGFSPDGRYLLVSVLRDDGGRLREKIEVIPAAGGPPVRSLEPPARAARWKWTPGGDALTFIREVDGARNIWRLPLAGGDARQVTSFTDDDLSDCAWTADGARLFYVRRQIISSDVVLITNFR